MLVNAGLSQPSRRPRAARAAGFTLIEAMVVVAMLAIVASLAAPGFRSFIGTINTKSVAFDLVSDLAYARSEAIKRNATASLEPAAGGWDDGWRVVAGGDVLRERPAPGSSIVVSAPPVAITFRASGRLGDDAMGANLEWRVSSPISGVTPRCILMTPTGAARSRTGGCA